jgi:broad specificity phosphatase PhoE
MTASIILVRHGQTAWNATEVFRGRIDIELDEAGLKQAELLGEHLGQRELEAVYSSPLKRAVQTAEAIVRHHHGLAVEIAPGLNDMDFGEWQGLSLQEVRSRFSESFEMWVTEPHRGRIPSGESLDDVRQRVLTLVNQIVDKHEGTVVLVSHRVVSKVLICALLGLDNSRFWDIRLDTCGMTTFELADERFVLTEHNNTSFLESLKQKRLRDF